MQISATCGIVADMGTTLVLLLVAALAYANGANDHGKGVATLVGNGSATPTRALVWAAITTAAGGVLSLWVASGLIKAFSLGLFASSVHGQISSSFYAAVLVGAVGWVLVATRTGMPVSTTHALIGGLIGAGLVSLGAGPIRWHELAARVALPLVAGPMLSLGIVYAFAWPIGRLVRRAAAADCVCVVPSEPNVAGSAIAATSLTVVRDRPEICEQLAPAVAVRPFAIVDGVHWFSAGWVGFARGWNDTPKIAALGVAALAAGGNAHAPAIAFAIVTLAMAAGGVIGGRRVLETLAKKLTPLPMAESLTASLSTAGLVSAASWLALPVSTTHVATGGIVGAGLASDARAVRWSKVGEIVLSWVVTLPVAALLAAIAKLVLRF